MYISSRDNANIKQLVKLISGKKARSETGLFVIEGMRSCVDAVMEASAGNLEISELYYTSQSVEKYSSTLNVKCFDDIPQSKKFEISTELAEKISGEETSQGVFVVAKKLDKILSADTIDCSGKYIVLDFVQDPGNLGTVLRTADAVGISGVVLTNNCCDLYNPKVVRSTMGSLPRVNVYIENDFYKVADIFKEAGIVNCASVISGGSDITDFCFSRPCAVYIGNEGKGMPQEHSDYCDEKITIKMHGNINSLNAASAATIMLWEMFRND